MIIPKTALMLALAWSVMPLLAVDGPDRALLEWRKLVTEATNRELAGDFPQAESTFLTALSLARTVTDRKYAVPVTYNDLGILYGELGRTREAERAYTQAISGFLLLGDEGIEMLVTPIGNLVALYLESGQIGLAAAEIRRLDGVPEATLSVPNRMRLHTARARVMQRQRKFAAAEDEYQTALRLAVSAAVVPPMDIANALNNLGTAEADLKRFPAARLYLERCVAVFELVVGPESPRLVVPLMNLATMVAQDRKHPADALPHLERALHIAEQSYGPGHGETARVLTFYANALRACGRKKEAKSAAARARVITASTGRDPNDRYTVNVNSLRSGR